MKNPHRPIAACLLTKIGNQEHRLFESGDLKQYTVSNIGLTKREYYVSNAPKEIADWFQHKERERPKSPEYSCTEEEQQKINGWRKDPCYDLAEQNPDLEKIQKMYQDFWTAKIEWEQQNRIDRMAQWPIFWADTILTELEK